MPKISSKIRLLLIFFVFMMVGLVKLVGLSQAADQTVTCDESGCSGITGPLFSETNVAPLDSLTHTITARNQYTENRTFAIQVEDSSFADSSPSLADVLTVTITEQESATTVYGPQSLTQWKNDGFVTLSSIASGSEKNYDVTVTLADVDNEYQNKELTFTLLVGFDTVEPDSGIGGPTDTGGVAGTTTTAAPPVCHDQAPTTAPVLIATAAGPNSVLLSWSPVSPVTHYTIIYGTSPGIPLYGAANVGNVVSYTISGLAGGTAYYFQVAGVNGCAPGPFSSEASVGVTGAFIATAPAPGFNILGIATPSATVEEPSGEVAGQQTCEDTSLWWWPLVAQLILTVAWYARKKDRKSLRQLVLIPIAISLFSQLTHWWVGCRCADSRWCAWYWVINLCILVLTSGAYILWRQRVQKQATPV